MGELDYRHLFEKGPVPIVVLDRDLVVVAVNDAYLRATLTKREALVGRGIFEAMPPDPANPQGGAVIRRLFERVIAERRMQRLDLQRYDVPRQAGGGYERRYWSAELHPLMDSDGGVAYIRCIVWNVSDPIREERMRQLWAVEGVGVIFFDREGTIISANDTFLGWIGYDASDVAAGRLNWRKLTPPEHVPASEAELERLEKTGRIGPYEKEYITRDGGRRWMLFMGGRLDDGSVAEFVLDLSERKAVEAQRREMEERYRTLFDSIDAGFCVIEMIYDAEGRPYDYRFVEVNPAFERQTGMRDPTSKTMREHIPNHEDDWFEIYGRVADTGEPVRFVNESSALGRWFELYAFPVGEALSHRVGVLFNDISERVRAERALEQEARRKDEFIATLAHELRNPLAPIRNAVSMLQLRPDPDAELREIGSLIDRQVIHLSRLVDDLLDVSRITFGKVHLQRAPLDLRDVVRDAVATSQPLISAKDHLLNVDVGDQPVFVDGDAVRLAQVVANLLNNAARYTPPGGEISVDIAADGKEARISVEDNGMGIDPADVEAVFEPFAQRHRKEAPGAGGIGIGLALARALVGLHGGRVSDLATSQASVLRRLGHEVEVAYNGEAALDKAREFHPEIVLLDLGLPGIDGFEVARRLRAEHDGDLKIVAQTGWGQEEDRRRTREAGFDAHLAKPVDMAALQQLL